MCHYNTLTQGHHWNILLNLSPGILSSHCCKKWAFFSSPNWLLFAYMKATVFSSLTLRPVTSLNSYRLNFFLINFSHVPLPILWCLIFLPCLKCSRDDTHLCLIPDFCVKVAGNLLILELWLRTLMLKRYYPFQVIKCFTSNQ